MARGRPTRQEVYERFDSSLEALQLVGGLPLPWEAESIWKDIWHRETHHSTAIEGNTLALRQVATLLEEGRAVGNKELREYLEVEGYGKAAHWVYSQAIRQHFIESARAPLTLREIREIHKICVGSAWDVAPPDPMRADEHAGSFRTSELQQLRNGLIPPSASEVHAQISTWVEGVNAGPLDGQPLPEWLAARHAHFERIHPFRDGNGRVGRLLLNLLLVRNGAPPAVIYKRSRGDYLKGLGAADKGDPGRLGELIARAVCNCAYEIVLPAIAGPARYVPIAALADDEVSHNALRSAAARGRLESMKIKNEYYSSREKVEEYKQSRHRGKRAS
jgi:fido (protein-threonine AMPylation protein)